MKFLISAPDYHYFLQWLYSSRKGLAQESYKNQLRARIETAYMWAHFYSTNLQALGHEAADIFCDNWSLQSAWARENDCPLPSFGERLASKVHAKLLRTFSSRRSQGSPDQRWMYPILEKQIESYRPDVFLVHNLSSLDPAFLKQIKPHVRLLVGQHGSHLDQAADYSCYDLVLSSLPHYVKFFRDCGLRSEPLKLGFEASVLERLPSDGPPRILVTFVGKVGFDHIKRIRFLEALAKQVDYELWGFVDRSAPAAIRQRHRGFAWGLQMFQILRRSLITINHHEHWAGPHANNMRLYEATGVGTMLVTDYKDDLAPLFAPGQEVAVYRSPEECADLIAHYLTHGQERDCIARAGQRRALAEHTYYLRMQELCELAAAHLRLKR